MGICRRCGKCEGVSKLYLLAYIPKQNKPCKKKHTICYVHIFRPEWMRLQFDRRYSAIKKIALQTSNKSRLEGVGYEYFQARVAKQ